MTRKRLLIVAHAPSPHTQRMRDAITQGAQAPEVESVEALTRTPFETGPDDVRAAQALILLTPENFGYMSGALKDFFDRCYYPCLTETQGLPYALCIRAGNDGSGARRAVETIVTGLRWRMAQPPLICAGAWREAFIPSCRDLGMSVAAGLDAGVF